MGSVHRRLRGAAAAFRAVWARIRPERESGGIAPCFADFGGLSQRSCATTRGLVAHAVANHHRKPLTCGLDAFRGLQENESTRAVSTDAITTSLRVTDAVLEKLRSMKDRHAQICELLLQPDLAPRDMASLGKELSGLETVVQLHGELEELQQELNNLTEMERDSGEDAEIREMASSERRDTEAQLTEMEGRIVVELLPKDKDDGKDVILEVRAGTGGDEAGLFAADLFAMYKKHAGIQGWRFEDLDVTKVGDGNSSGIKSASASLSGDSIYSHLKFENGVHRVQRVPTTDTQGRIHTSTATVVVMPEADEVDVNLSESDIRVDVFRASGAGGQHVNTTESAVRMTHIPTGITVSMQDERSQHRNRAKALTVLRARVYDAERRKAQEALQERRSTAGTGDRGERIRTYNFKEGRITDHRVGLTEHGIDEMLAGELLTRFTQALQVQERMDLMETMEGESS